jgi:SAM-dependent methyltransferase
MELASKYDGLAEGFAESSYMNLVFYMERRVLLATNWGSPLSPGDSVIELGCGDGYLARLFASRGLRYFGVDVSPGMVAMAKRRLLEGGLEADFTVAEVDRLDISEPCDAVVSYMRSFFTYVKEPLALLTRLRPYIRKKVIVDLDPRRDISVKAAIEIMKQAGFSHVHWRPFFVPERTKLPATLLKTLAACESVPLVRSLPLRWKFHALVKGEVY